MPAGACLYQKNSVSEQWHARRGFFVSQKQRFWVVTCPQGLFRTSKTAFMSSNMPAGAFFVSQEQDFRLAVGSFFDNFRGLGVYFLYLLAPRDHSLTLCSPMLGFCQNLIGFGGPTGPKRGPQKCGKSMRNTKQRGPETTSKNNCEKEQNRTPSDHRFRWYW